MTDQSDDTTLDLPHTTAEVLERIHSRRAELEAVLAPLSNEQLTIAGSDGGWSIKDHLAHIVAWEQIALGRLRGTPEHELYGVDESAVETLDIDRLNDILHKRDRGQSLPEALAAFRTSHAQIVAYVSDMTNADLQAALAADDARPRVQKIAGDTYDHYPEHRGWIRALLANAH